MEVIVVQIKKVCSVFILTLFVISLLISNVYAYGVDFNEWDKHGFLFRYLQPGTSNLDVVLYDYIGDDSTMDIPDYVLNKRVAEWTSSKVVGIQHESCKGYANIVEVIIPASVEYIEYQAFEGCTNLEKVSMPYIMYIYPRAFFGCSKIKEIDLGNRISFGGGEALGDCKSLEKIEYYSNITEGTISEAFVGCTNLKTIVVGDYVTEIPDSMFKDMTSVTEIEISNSVVKIAENSFDGIPSFTIVCQKGSYAASYAKEHNIKVDFVDSEIEYENGDGTSTNPFLVSTEDELNEVRNNLTAHYKLNNDIVLSKNWMPIGDSLSNCLSGSFDGNGYTIIDLNAEGECVGLFGYNAGTIKNLTVLVANIDSKEYSGGICGYNYGIIKNCDVYGGQISSDMYAGGITGYNCTGSRELSGNITDCYSYSKVSGGEYAGGIAGYSQNALIDRCSAECYVSGEYAGGLVGYSSSDIYNSSAVGNTVGTTSGGIVGLQTGYKEVSNCYSNVIVLSDEYAGGIAGRSSYTSLGRCSSHSDVSGKYAGGLVGDNSSDISESASFGNVTATFDGGGIIGVQSGDNNILNCYSTSIVSGKNIASVGMQAGGLIGRVTGDSRIVACYTMGSTKAIGSSIEKYIFIGVDKSSTKYVDCYYLYYGQKPSGGKGTPISAIDLQNKDTYSDWSFGDIWVMSSKDYIHPILIGLENQKQIPVKLYGDVNGDLKLDSSDYLLLGKHILNNIYGIDISSSDVTNDGTINRKDLLRLAKYFAGWNVTLH